MWLPWPSECAVEHLLDAARKATYVADPPEVLREARRVLVPGGAITAIEVDYATCRADPSTPALEALFRAMVQGMAVAGWSDAGTRLPDWLHDARAFVT
jgi:hypothetical protein